MRIVHVSCWDTRGGAAIAASRLHLGLLAQGVDSHMLCARVQGDLPNNHLISQGIRFQKDRALNAVTDKIATKQNDPTSFGCSINFFSNALIKRLNELKPDVVHLHWVGASTVSIALLEKIQYPIVWTLHDMWPFCGAEHYDVTGEQRWATGYTAENRPVGATGPDISRKVWEAKMKHWKNLTIHFVGVSSWITECCRESAVFRNLSNASTVRCIHNGLDREIFNPQPKKAARAKLGIRRDAKLLVFGAYSMVSSVKGGDLLVEALKALHQGDMPVELCVFGRGGSEIDVQMPVHDLGSIKDPHDMATVYSAGDVMLVPSRIESFGQTASEALACGTPVVCFDTSGLRDIVRNGVCGRRATTFEPDAFFQAIIEVLNKNSDQADVSEQANVFDLKKISSEYLGLYTSQL